MVLGVLKGSHILAKVSKPEGDIKVTAKMFKRMFCSFSASGGHLAVLKWAQANGCLWDEMTYARDAENVHLGVQQCVGPLVLQGRNHVRDCCKNRASQGLPKSSGQRLPLRRTDVRGRCLRRVTRFSPVGAGSGLNLGQLDVRQSCRIWAPRGPSVGKSPRVPIRKKYEGGAGRKRASQGPPLGAGIKVHLEMQTCTAATSNRHSDVPK